MKKIICDFCNQEIKDEKSIWYFQFPYYKKTGAYANGKLIGKFESHLGYKIMEICPACASNFARGIEEQMHELGIEF